LQTALPPPPDTADPDTLAAGERLFARFCSVCHGEAAVAGGVIPDLRTSPFLPVDAWDHIVLDGILNINGMAPFGAVLNRSDATAIRAYVIRRANQDNTAVAEATRANRM
jgi:alcohol dehydrogenase (cytochrome c)/quinohemoprotein ethanol dehydrogenase